MTSKANETPLLMKDRQTRLSLLVGLGIWFLHLNVVYPLTSLACHWGWFPSEIFGMPGLRFVQIAATLVAILGMIGAIYIPWREWRDYRAEQQSLREKSENDRHPFLSFVVIGVNSFFLLYLIASFVPIFTLYACG